MEIEIHLPPDTDRQRTLFGTRDTHLRMLRKSLGVSLVARKGRLIIDGEEESVGRAVNVVERMLEAIEQGESFLAEEFAALIETVNEERERDTTEGVIFTERLKITAKTRNQQDYISAIRKNGLTFGIGPAGTGKTYLAVGCAVEALRHGEVKRIVLTRPAVEAGEHLGFLPGDMREKVDPYLKPIYDALDDMISRRQLAHYLETGVIEVAPLAFMRGRTLSRSFVILDEAQNTTPGQMKMLLTRLGPFSHSVVNGDLTQIDLGTDNESGLVHASRILAGVENIGVIRLSGEDIVRHKLVRSIVAAYDRDEQRS